MANTRSLSTSALTSIASQVSAAMPGALFLGGSSRQPSEIGESLDIYALGAEDVRGDAALSEVATPLNSFYHLIYQDDLAAGHARSSVALGADTPRVTEISDDTQLSTLVRQALESIDKVFSADHWLVSMLMAPAYHVTALWVRGQNESRVCVLQSDATSLPVNNTLATTSGDLARDERDFMTLLASSSSAQGLVL
jgi:hypothetical protein